jgi:predicted kinase
VEDLRAVLIGGTSHTGKTTAARAVADRLGFAHVSTDLLARHPGRPWRTPEREVPPHVAEHYRTLGTDELIASVLDHYARLWPRIADLVASAGADGGAGLVVEGSAVWPTRAARLGVPGTAAVWLTADPAVLRARVRRSGGHPDATEDERHLIDRFAARAVRFQELLLDAAADVGGTVIDNGADRSAAAAADAVLTAVAARPPSTPPPSGGG